MAHRHHSGQGADLVGQGGAGRGRGRPGDRPCEEEVDGVRQWAEVRVSHTGV